MDLASILYVVALGIIFQGHVKNSILAEDDKCLFEDEHSINKMPLDSASIEDVKIILSSETCRIYVKNVCDNSKVNNVKKINKISLCFLQFDETCACGTAIKTTDWIDGLLECPTKLLQMEQTPDCLRSKLCDTIESNRGLKSLFVEKFTNERGKQFCRAEDKEQILKRERRQASLPKLNCTSFTATQASLHNVASLSSIDASVFRDCPRSLVSPNYTMDQLTTVAGQAVASLGDPCKWSEDNIQNLSLVILGFNETVLNCIPFSNASVTSVGKSLYFIPSSMPKLEQLYNRWKNRTMTSGITSDKVSLLQGLTCAFGTADLDSMLSTEFSKSIGIFSQYNCFKYSTFVKLYNLTCASFGASGSSWNATTIKNVGNIVAGMPQDVFVQLSSEKMSAICPSVFSVLRFEILQALSANQTTAMTVDQLRAIPQAVLANLTADRRDLVISLLQKYSQMSTGITVKVTPSINASITTQTQGAMTNESSTKTTKAAFSDIVPAATNGTGKSVTTILANDSRGYTTLPSDSNYQNGSTATPQDPNAPSNGQTFSTQSPPNDQAFSSQAPPNDQTFSSQDPSNGQTFSSQGPPNGQALSTQGPPNGQVPDNLPNVINASNIKLFLRNIGSKLSTEDVQRIDPSALANPEVLTSLSNNELDLSMRLALTEKVEEMLSKATEFNPQLYASGQNFIQPKRFQSLTSNQLEMIVNVPNYKPSLNLLPVIGPKVAAILLGDPSKMATFKNTLITIPNSDFSKLINKQKITQDFLRPFNGSLLSDKQSRDVYKNFLTDSGVDVKNMDPSAKTQLLLSLPDFLSPSVRTGDVQGLNPDASFSILKTIEHSLQNLHGLDNRNGLDLGSNDQPLPVEYELYDMMLNGSQISEDQMDFLLAKRLLTVKKIKDMKNDVCGIILDKGVYLGTDPTLVSTIFDQCSSNLVDQCKSMLTLPEGFMTPDELHSIDAKLVLQLCLMEICPEAAWISDSMTKLIVDVIESLANKRPEILLYPRLIAFLPKLKISTLELLNNSLSIGRICEEMACEMPGNIPAAVIREKTEFCLRNNASLRSLSCTGEDSSLFLSMAMENFFQLNVTCEQFLFDVDVLQADVINCRARSAVYNCAKNLNFTNANEVAQLGSLIDQMSDEEFNKIPKKFLCGFLPIMSGLYEKWNSISEERISAGFKALEMCPRMMTYQRLMAVDASTECSGLASATRKKRQADSKVTCPLIYQMSRNVVELTASQLGTMSKEDFINCVDILGRVDGFNESQWNALANLAKNAYGSDPGKWTSDIITSSAGIISGLSPAEISSLVLDQVEAISAVGKNGLWNDEKLSSAFGSVKKNLLKDNLTSLRSPQLRSMGEVICGATVIDISAIPLVVVCESFQNIGQLEECAENQMAEFLRGVKDPSCLGPSPSSWTSSNIYALGSLIGGLTKDDLSKLSNEQLRFISPSSIPFISPMQFNGFTADQLQQLSLDQAARITSSQLKSLDANKKKIIEDKLSSIKAEIALSLTGDSGIGERLGSNVLVLVLAFSAAVLREF